MSQTDHFVDPALFVPPATQDNYAQAARMAARQNGTSVGEEWAALISQFEAQHEADGAAGWNHLAAWARATDPETIGVLADPAELRKARALASAIQDPNLSHGLDFETDTVEAKAVRHAHETNAERFLSEPGSPAGSPPANIRGGNVGPDVEPGGDLNEGTEAQTPAEADPERRGQRRPQRTATPNGPQETR